MTTVHDGRPEDERRRQRWRMLATKKANSSGHGAPSAWSRFEPSTSAVMLPEGWSLASSTDDRFSNGPAMRYEQPDLRRQNSALASLVSDNSGVQSSNASMRSTSTTHPSSSAAATGAASGRADPGPSYPPSSSSSRLGRRLRRISRPTSSAAESTDSRQSQSIFSASEASTGLTLPSPVSSSVNLNKWLAGRRSRRAETSPADDAVSQSDASYNFDITIPDQRATSEIEHGAYVPNGWTHESIDSHYADDAPNWWANSSAAPPTSEGEHSMGQYPQTMSLQDHTSPVHTRQVRRSLSLGEITMPNVTGKRQGDGRVSRDQARVEPAPRVDYPTREATDTVQGNREQSAPATTQLAKGEAPRRMSELRRRLLAARPSFDVSRKSVSKESDPSRPSRETMRTERSRQTEKSRQTERSRQSTSSQSQDLDRAIANSYIGSPRKAKTSLPSREVMEREVDADQIKRRPSGLAMESMALPAEETIREVPEPSESRNPTPTQEDLVPSPNPTSSKGTGDTFLGKLKRRQSKRQGGLDKANDRASHPSLSPESSAETAMSPAPPASSLLLSSLSPRRLASKLNLSNGNAQGTEEKVLTGSEISRPMAARSLDALGGNLDRAGASSPFDAVENHAQTTRHRNAASSVEHNFNVAHDRRWSQQGSISQAPSEKQEEMLSSQGHGEQQHAASRTSESYGREKRTSFSGVRQHARQWFARKGLDTPKKSQGIENIAPARTSFSVAEAPRRFSLSNYRRGGATSSLGHSSSDAMLSERARGIGGNGSLHFLAGPTGSKSVTAFHGLRDANRSLDLQHIIRSPSTLNFDKPLPPLPPLADSMPADARPSGISNAASMRRSSFGDTPIRTSRLAAANIDATLPEQEEPVMPSPRVQRQEQGTQTYGTQTQALTTPANLAGMLNSRQTRSFSDLFAFDQMTEGLQAGRQAARQQSLSSSSRMSSPPVSLHVHSRRPNFGLDLQPDAAAAFDSIPLPDTPIRRQSSVEGRRAGSRRSSRAESLLEVRADAPLDFDGPGDVSDSGHDSLEDIEDLVTAEKDGDSANATGAEMTAVKDMAPVANVAPVDVAPTAFPQDVEDEFLDALEVSPDEDADATVSDEDDQSETEERMTGTLPSSDVEMLADEMDAEEGEADKLRYLSTAGSTTSLVTATDFDSAHTHQPDSPRAHDFPLSSEE